MARDRYRGPWQYPEGEWLPVSSTCLSLVRWVRLGGAGPVLEVEFRESGKRYRYFGVDRELFEDLINAPSRGVFFNREIKDTFRSWPL